MVPGKTRLHLLLRSLNRRTTPGLEEVVGAGAGDETIAVGEVVGGEDEVDRQERILERLFQKCVSRSIEGSDGMANDRTSSLLSPRMSELPCTKLSGSCSRGNLTHKQTTTLKSSSNGQEAQDAMVGAVGVGYNEVGFLT